jgi:hypothetical protein
MGTQAYQRVNYMNEPTAYPVERKTHILLVLYLLRQMLNST